ncbi:MAG: hypothetical protein IJ762_03075 [Bacteroidaceae bacterium]|nr:hypothetical protein [Bacteroidaceae bacterium]MBR1788162.1 hypothetical protein [Bacteroidaceae bacterium]
MNDNELDRLITASIERRKMLENLNEVIVADIRRQARRAWIRRWGRIVAFSFGLPLVLIVFALSLRLLLAIPSMGPARFCLLIPVATMLYFARRAMKDFSIAEV